MRGATRGALALLPALAAAKDMHAAIQSTRGVQHEVPLISDDFVVGCIMVMFLMLFAFGTLPVCSTRRARKLHRSRLCELTLVPFFPHAGKQ